MNLAMWSGPRNLSTAMMYSFAQRSDCVVADEPFYAAYLAKTGLAHPMREDIIRAGETDAERVIEYCCGEGGLGKAVFYQKHMTQHMLPDIRRDWIVGLTNVFLLRDPARVIASYHAKREDPNLADIGVKEQAELFDIVKEGTGEAPMAIDCMDVLSNPEGTLKALCEALGLAFEASMLEWELGPRTYDGIWAPHWYDSVWKSRGFGRAPQEDPVAPTHLRELLDESRQYYEYIKEKAQMIR